MCATECPALWGAALRPSFKDMPATPPLRSLPASNLSELLVAAADSLVAERTPLHTSSWDRQCLSRYEHCTHTVKILFCQQDSR